MMPQQWSHFGDICLWPWERKTDGKVQDMYSLSSEARTQFSSLLW